MRAMVMDINNKQMVVMREDGTFEKVKKHSGVLIGDEITLSATPVSWKNINKYVSVAASIMLVFLGSLQVKAYYTPYGYVNIDINPSIELGFNKYERIISTRGINGDGEKVLKTTPSIKHSKLETATRSIIEAASNDDYIKKDQDNDIVFSIYTPNKERNKNLNTKINSSVLQYLKTSGKKAELINEIVSKEDLSSATLQKVSVGKLKLYEKAKAVNPNITIDDIKDKSVRDIMRIIRTVKKGNKVQDNKVDDKNTNIKQDAKISVDNRNAPSIEELDERVGVKPSDKAKLGNGVNNDSVKSERKEFKEFKKSELRVKRDLDDTFKSSAIKKNTEKQKVNNDSE